MRSTAWAAISFVLAVLAVLPGTRPRADLASVCSLEAGGRFGVSCDIDKAGEAPEYNWLRTNLVVFEDGIPLRDVSHSRQVRKQGLGTFVTETGVLWFSSLDGSSPLTNGKRYEATTVEGPAGLLSPGLRLAAAVLSLLALIAVGLGSGALAQGVAIAITVVCIVIQVMGVLKYAPVHVDAGSSLPTARFIAEGALPYKDILFNYTPLGVMALAGWGMLGPADVLSGNVFSLGLVLILEAACAFLVFRICRALGVAPLAAGLAAVSYLSMFIWFDGSRILLEPMYLLVVLSALLVIITKPPERSPWIAGGLSALALLIKQYGGFGFWGALVASLGFAKPLRAAGRVILGAGAVLVGVSGLLLLFGVDLRVLVTQTAGTDYARRWETIWFVLYFSAAPFLVLGPLLFVRREWRQRTGIIALLGFLLASWLPLIVRQHQYYLHNPSAFLFISFAVLAAFAGAGMVGKRARLVEIVAVLCLVSIPIRIALKSVERMPSLKGVQERRARLMTSYWPSGEPVLMFAPPSFMALTGYVSPAPATLGYRFLRESSLEQLRAGMRGATAAWIDPGSMYANGDFASVGTTLRQELERFGFKQQMLLEDRYELWTKNGVPPARELPAPIDGE